MQKIVYQIGWMVTIVALIISSQLRPYLPEKSPTLIFLSCLYHTVSIFLLRNELVNDSKRGTWVIMILASFLVVSGLANLLSSYRGYDLNCHVVVECLQTIILLSSLPVACLLLQKQAKFPALLIAIVSIFSTLSVSYELVIMALMITSLHLWSVSIHDIDIVDRKIGDCSVLWIGYVLLSYQILKDLVFHSVFFSSTTFITVRYI